MRTTRLALVACVLVLSLGLVGCAGSGSGGYGGYGGTGSDGTTATETTAPTGATVVEQGLAFEPATLEVAVGDTVTFKNQDSTQHIVRIDGKDLDAQGPGTDVTWTAEKAGSFPYSCTIHPSMTGEIVVK